ncbi:glycosyltransferase family 4 protein [Clostridium perfringens]|nr:glycosyltransferase family 4 protein [Clostridium perfringens]
MNQEKNLKTLIKALSKINKETGMRLVICGKYGWKCEEERNLIEENKENIVFLNYVTDEEKFINGKLFCICFSIYI